MEMEDAMAKISIIVPVYNVERYLKECLDSIQKQTLSDIEIICVDDGSTDGSAEILDEYMKLDSRFQVIHKQNEGYGKSMNLGISLATAPYIGIVESDDMIETDMYEKLYALMEEKRVDVIKADYFEFYEGGDGNQINEYHSLISEARLRQCRSWRQGDLEKVLGMYDTVFNIRECEDAFLFEKYTWSGVYSRKFLQENYILHNETPGASYQDNGFWFQTMIKAKSIYFTKQAFYHYRIDNLNSSIHSKEKVFAVCDEYEYIYHIINQMGEEGKTFCKWASYFKIVDCLANILRVDDQYKDVLAERVRKEFLLAIERGDIEINLYSNYLKSRLFDISISPISYVKKEKERIKKIDDVINLYDQIAIYGAGILGQRMYEVLRVCRRNIKVKYFAVTDLEGNPDSLYGVPVKQIDELLRYKENMLVIISIGKKYIQEIEHRIKAMGFPHYVLMRDIDN